MVTNTERSNRQLKRSRSDCAAASTTDNLNADEFLNTEELSNNEELLNTDELLLSENTPTPPNQPDEKSKDDIILELEETIKELREDKKKFENHLKELNQEFERIEETLRNFFTPGQIKRILLPQNKKYSHWSSEDIESTISLRSVSSKAYRYLRTNKYPLPALSTLRKRASTLSLSQGCPVKIAPAKTAPTQQPRQNSSGKIARWQNSSDKIAQ